MSVNNADIYERLSDMERELERIVRKLDELDIQGRWTNRILRRKLNAIQGSLDGLAAMALQRAYLEGIDEAELEYVRQGFPLVSTDEGKDNGATI
tara:strand:- start:6122 stop:6406 length:285 start_codon:yes stop_codon:yes gene_type:complete